MRYPFSIVMFSLACAFVLGSASQVKACSCDFRGSTCETFGTAPALFVGKVVGAAHQRTEPDEDGTTTTYDIREIYFAVEEAFSGLRGQKRLTIRSGNGDGDCGYWFRRGESYLVYAYGNEKKGFGTNICTGTSPVSDAIDDLNFLRRLPSKGSGVSINGRVAETPQSDDEDRKPKPLARITITITHKDGKQTELLTNDNGSYEISGLKAGEYEVRAGLPDYYYKDDYSVHKLKVLDRGCARADFAAVANGQITGRIIDADGNPVKKGKVSLIKADAQGFVTMRSDIGFNYLDDEQGRFKMDRIPPGEYLLGINITSTPGGDAPYPATYYPDVRDRSRATVIKIGLGEKLSDYTLRLPAKLTERTIQGVVVWPDGTPAVGAEVYLTDQNHPGYIAGRDKTDATGWFTLVGYNEINYWVLASIYEPKQMHAEPPLTSLNGPVSGLRLVLSSEGSLCEHYYKKPEDK